MNTYAGYTKAAVWNVKAAIFTDKRCLIWFLLKPIAQLVRALVTLAGYAPTARWFCWGRDTYGEATPPEDSFQSVTAGGYHTCGVRTDGTVACWGSNEKRQAFPPRILAQSVSAGSGYSCHNRPSYSFCRPRSRRRAYLRGTEGRPSDLLGRQRIWAGDTAGRIVRVSQCRRFTHLRTTG